MLNIVLFGPPGAGKGTQSANLISKYSLVHLSTGDLLRSQIADKTDLGMKAQEFMNNGLLVPDEVVIGMIKDRVENSNGAKGFIFDGFPRTVPQAEALDTLLNDLGTPITGMVALEVKDEELVKRLLIRGETSNRPDDKNEELIRKRINEYNSKTTPVADYYTSQKKFSSVYGIGQIDEIFGNVCSAIENFSAKKH